MQLNIIDQFKINEKFFFTYLEKGTKYMAYLIKESTEFTCYLTVEVNNTQLSNFKDKKLNFKQLLDLTNHEIYLKKEFNNHTKLPISKIISKENINKFMKNDEK